MLPSPTGLVRLHGNKQRLSFCCFRTRQHGKSFFGVIFKRITGVLEQSKQAGINANRKMNIIRDVETSFDVEDARLWIARDEFIVVDLIRITCFDAFLGDVGQIVEDVPGECTADKVIRFERVKYP